MDVVDERLVRSAGASADSEEAVLVAHQLRPRVRLGAPRLRAHDRELLHRHLCQLGHIANSEGRHTLACAFFESAYNVKDDISDLVSAVNMRLKAGQYTLAALVYDRLLGDTCGEWSLSEETAALVRRKREEAEQLIAKRAARSTGLMTVGQDDAEQLLAPLAVGDLPGGEVDDLLHLMRQHGHATNAAGDIDAARLWFECAWALARSPNDLLSAANMRLKLDDTSRATELLYDYLLSLEEGLGEAEMDLTVRKLEVLRQRRSDEEQLVTVGETDECWDFVSWREVANPSQQAIIS